MSLAAHCQGPVGHPRVENGTPFLVVVGCRVLCETAWGRTTQHPAVHRIEIEQNVALGGHCSHELLELAMKLSFLKVSCFFFFLCSCRELLKGKFIVDE